MQENEFQTWLAQHAPNALGRAIVPQDGCSEERISAAQTRFGVAIPSSLRTLYQQLGECAMVMRSFQPLEMTGNRAVQILRLSA